MKLPKPTKKSAPENTITLINVVFLMLIFFLVAGSLTPPLDKEVAMIGTRDAENAAPPDALAVRADGSYWYRGSEITLDRYLADYPPPATGVAEAENGSPLKVVVDRDLPAEDLVSLTGALRDAGFPSVTVVTERQTQ